MTTGEAWGLAAILDRLFWSVTRDRCCDRCGCLCQPDEVCPGCTAARLAAA